MKRISAQLLKFGTVLIVIGCTSSAPIKQTSTDSAVQNYTSEQIGIGDRMPAEVSEPVNKFFTPAVRQSAGAVDWKTLFNQLLVWQIQNMEGVTPQNLDLLLERSIYYSPGSFRQTYKQIISEAANPKAPLRGSEAAYLARERLFSNQELRNSLKGDLKESAANITKTPAAALMSKIIASKADPKQKFGENQNYFESPLGQAVMSALSDTVFVIVPGFGSHSVAEVSWGELVRDLDRYYGRRPKVGEAPIKYMGMKGKPVSMGPMDGRTDELAPVVYYGSKRADRPVSFDVVTPMGAETVFSMGLDGPSAEALARFLNDLMGLDAYKNKKFLLLGYSKGCPITHNLVSNPDIRQKYPQVVNNVRAIITMAGVAQGAVPAETGINNLLAQIPVDQSLGNRTERLNDFAQEMQNSKDGVNDKLIPLISSVMGFGLGIEDPQIKLALATAGVSEDQIKTIVKNQLNSNVDYGSKDPNFVKSLGSAGISQAYYNQYLQNQLSTKDNHLAILGINSMTLYERIKWNLLNLHGPTKKYTFLRSKYTFDQSAPGSINTPITIFNFGTITNIKDFFHPGQIGSEGPTQPPLIAPQLKGTGGRYSLNYPLFSRDAVFLYFTSLTGFRQSPGGLYDTQVAFPDTKSFALDNRPLSESLSPDQIKGLAIELQKSGLNVNAATLAANIPRRDLLTQIYGEEAMQNLNFVDLGELRGNHWDIAFGQVYRPEAPHNTPEETYLHRFPRRALQTAMIETMALYGLTTNWGNSGTGGAR